MYNTVLCMIATQLQNIAKILQQIYNEMKKECKNNGTDNDGI